MSEPVPVCGCGRAVQVVWSPAWTRFVCPDCLRKLTAVELSEVTPLPADDPEPPAAVAYCAPGQKTAAALSLALHGKSVREVAETALLEGQEGVCYVVADPPEEITWPVTFSSPDCRICGRYPPWHAMHCPAFPWSAWLPPTGPLITGLPGV